MNIDRDLANAISRTDFGAFVYRAFEAINPGQRLIPNWHIDVICYHLQLMMNGEARKRLVINLPPRTLKSFIVSVALPAWLLGRAPSTRIICASYSDELATKFSRDCRALLETPFYKSVFPATRLNPKKAAEGEFETTKRGSRLATSVGGTLTGRGGGVLIIDDPIKANDAGSEVARRDAIDWFNGTARSRLDDPATSLVCIAMQRLHVEDLAGILIEQGWPKLVLPAIATEAADYVTGPDEVYHRPVGELLQPNRDSLEAIEELKHEIGSRVFAAQYQQNPTPPDGNMIKAAWLGRYDTAPERKNFQRVVLSCDPAGKAGPRNDYTAITVIGLQQQAIYLLEVSRGHWVVMQMRDQIIALAARWGVDVVVVEDTSSGMSLIQLLKEQTRLDVVGRQSNVDKETRMSRQQGRFEAGRILLPTEALWLADFENELLAFPDGRYDDQVDALLLFLDWFTANEQYLRPMVFCPPSSSGRRTPGRGHAIRGRSIAEAIANRARGPERLAESIGAL
jgi:predicted phage terminase large subunit-like protein